MHPVQAAPRQRTESGEKQWVSVDAPRAGSAEAKPDPSEAYLKSEDAPRAGSAEAK